LGFLFALRAFADTWHADNGDGTFTNPLFYDEFSDPDMIRVGDDFYLTGTTMHAMPGLPVLHSKDLVNWELLGYACERLDLGPEYRLENGANIYGQGIWAPSFRYHKGTFYIFSDVNHRSTQLFTANNPAGPWSRTELKRSFHDLSVLFDDDGKVYVVWGYRDIHLAQLTDDLKDVVPGTERIIIPKTAGMGEGCHFYKIGGRYYITSAWFAGRMRMACARADRPEGPYEVNPEISADEDFGLALGNRLANERAGAPFTLAPRDPKQTGRLSMHQGGLVQTQAGQWWGFSMMDYNSVGRLTCLSPIAWTDGWPYFGLPGNLERTPRTWVKPETGHQSPPTAPYQRNDDFSGPKLANVWQWNHVTDGTKWSLSERKGFLRLHSLPAKDFWWARNTLTQRAIGPESVPTVELDPRGMKPGDIAGLALLNYPYAWLGVHRGANGTTLEQYDQDTGKVASIPLPGSPIWLRAHCNFLTEKATFSYSTDGKKFEPIGDEFRMIFQGRTFQGVRYSLFSYNTGDGPGGYADFDRFTVDELYPHGLMQPIPIGKTVAFLSPADALLSVDEMTHFQIVDRKLGRVALQSGDRFVSVNAANGASHVGMKSGRPGDAETFQWTETPYGDVLLLSIVTDRYLCIETDGRVTADHRGPDSNRADGSCFRWHDVLK
jgi:beta-xylosidase